MFGRILNEKVSTTGVTKENRNCPYKQDVEMLPMRSRILAEALNKTIFSSNTVSTFIAFNDSVS